MANFVDRLIVCPAPARPGDRSTAILTVADRVFPCVLGRSGVTDRKREGDGATPVGDFPLREALFRPDRLEPPATGLPLRAIGRADGWCDDPADPAYNRPVRLPHAGRHEVLWRADGQYDLLAVIGHNDDPPKSRLGSAIFLHVARADGAPTAGCVALALADLRTVLAACGPETRIAIKRR